jgi:valyl-tRNA synthetase
MWDVDVQTAVAQAEVEDRSQAGALHDVAFGVEGSDRDLVVATTRPEMLPACVGVTAHPDDARWKDLFGKTAITPIFHVPVPIFASELADPEKGTGILMVCTFGDATDVQWWSRHKLALRQIIGRNGRIMPVRFGEAGWESRNPEAAAAAHAQIAGKTVVQARAAVVELLRRKENAATPGRGAPLMGEPKPIERPVKFFEKGDRPLEFIPTRQWFVKLMDRKAELVDQGRRIRWHPGFMEARYRTWTEGLQMDWCISRQRYFGVQIPVWYRLDAAGQPDHDHPIVAALDRMPVDPTVDVPPGFDASARGKPGGFAGEADVFDTWFTSSLTPQIGSHWVLDPARHRQLFPADIRPQSHEIIRTWAFYTIAKAMLHDALIPWHHVLVSGWILDPDRKKMSKSRGNVVTPIHLLDGYTADGVRYWAASARLGTDTAFDEKVLAIGKRLVTKVFNASKYVLSQTGPVRAVTHELDRAFVHKLKVVVREATAAMDGFDYASALELAESTFWSSFTDTYLELTKARCRGESATGDDGRGSAVASLRLGLSVFLRLLAPVLPYITEEVWSWCFAAETGQASIHRAPWPAAAELETVVEPESLESLAVASAALYAVNRRRTELGTSVGRPLAALTLAASPATRAVLARVLEDVAAAVRCPRPQVVDRPGLDEGTVAVEAIELAPAPAAEPRG